MTDFVLKLFVEIIVEICEYDSPVTPGGPLFRDHGIVTLNKR